LLLPGSARFFFENLIFAFPDFVNLSFQLEYFLFFCGNCFENRRVFLQANGVGLPVAPKLTFAIWVENGRYRPKWPNSLTTLYSNKAK
jgi:hypothetical protein